MEIQRRVMLVDDDNIINILNERMLEVTRFASEVKSYSQAELALEQIKKCWSSNNKGLLPDIIFLDINMPNMDGWEFLEELMQLPAEFLKNCIIILLTSSIDFNDIEKSVSYPLVSNFVSKPLTPDKLKSISRKEKLNFLFEGE